MKTKIIIETSDEPDIDGYDRFKEIYTQVTDKEVDIYEVIKSFNDHQNPFTDKSK
jgi:hypothetical protein